MTMDIRERQAENLLKDYRERIAQTDKLDKDDLRPILLGLYGEVGSIMATAKKLHREKEAYSGYKYAAEEEFGDALWYFAMLCKRLGCNVENIFSETPNGEHQANRRSATESTNDDPPLSSLDDILLKLGRSAATLFELNMSRQNESALLHEFAEVYAEAIQLARVSLETVVRKNAEKACGRFLEPDPDLLPLFDHDFFEEERLPQHFEIQITQRKSGQSYLQWNGVFIGEPLTDSIADPDGYRFHDVFHLAHAAILHWSPTFRALIKQKRKSDSHVDQTQDGGRAIVIEEGLTAWVFVRAKELNFFEGQNTVSFDLLKGVQQFVQGYEVAACPLKLWERAILDGYAVFRQVRGNNGGIVVGDRGSRSINYRSA